MNTAPTSTAEPKAGSLLLTIRGVGHIPSMKNNKRLFFTNHRIATLMKMAAADLELQFVCAYRTDAHAMATGQSLQSWTLSHLPLDDSLDWIGVPCGSWRRVSKGSEGADVLIEPL